MALYCSIRDPFSGQEEGCNQCSLRLVHPPGGLAMPSRAVDRNVPPNSGGRGPISVELVSESQDLAKKTIWCKQIMSGPKCILKDRDWLAVKIDRGKKAV